MLISLYLCTHSCSCHSAQCNQGHPKSAAISSLITEFETEVTTIEQRITNPMICDEANSDDYSSSQENDSDPKLLMQELQEGWIALEDPDSGDIYYSNEVGDCGLYADCANLYSLCCNFSVHF